MADFKEVKNLISPRKNPDKQFCLDLLDREKQQSYEEEHLSAVLLMLKFVHIKKLLDKIKSDRAEREELCHSPDYDAEKYRRVLELNAEIEKSKQEVEAYRCFFTEPYFARMDLVDDKDGYNSYFIGKKGDEALEIVDWRAPLARKYFQKSQLNFSINQFDYRLILRRAVRAFNGKITDFQNEYLNLNGYLSEEEIGGRDEAVIFDPFLKDILSSRKEKQEICDIIETIQEKQYEIITAPERVQFVVQGVAGSGKTMIMLHRLSYLMYNNEDIKPANVLVITPSDSFNAFIDELAQVLELEKVKTTTLDVYFINLLRNQGIDVDGKIDYFAPVNEDYLSYIYSSKFSLDVDKKLAKIYDSVCGMLSAESGEEFISDVMSACEEQLKEYEKIKNAGLRVRRCVLGEIKEKPDGGLYYTKQMRALFNCVLDVKEFLTLNLSDARMKGYFYFYRQLLSFYKSVRFIRRYGEKICLTAKEDLINLSATIDKEISDLKRYKIISAGKEEYTYPDRIARREETKKEIDATICRVERILSRFFTTFDFADVIRGEGYLVHIGKCENMVDVARFIFKEIVKKAKSKYGVSNKKLCRSDPFVLCLLLSKLGYDLSPKYSFVFVDEAQDLSPAEYGVLRCVNSNACFNVFGDLKQNVTRFRGVSDWAQLGYETYELNLNYRNTNQIVEYVAGNLGIDMQAIGLSGDEVEFIPRTRISRFLADKKGLRAIITSEANLAEFSRKSYNVLRNSGRISKTKINVMTVYESKGLEFSAVAVVDGDMSPNEKYIACTRALKNLAIVR
ncbi:MAG: UvrD-helicase domain-containing protein [Candidatus Coproplasma sp.]